MRCEDIRALLSEHADGVLEEGQAQLLQEHLDGCGVCREELVALKKTIELLHEMPEIDPPEELYGQIIDRIDSVAGQQNSPDQANMIWAFFGGQQFRAAVAALLVFSVGLFAFRQMSRDPAKEARQELDRLDATAEMPEGQPAEVPVPKSGLKDNEKMHMVHAFEKEDVAEELAPAASVLQEEDTFAPASTVAPKRASNTPVPSAAAAEMRSSAVRLEGKADKTPAVPVPQAPVPRVVGGAPEAAKAKVPVPAPVARSRGVLLKGVARKEQNVAMVAADELKQETRLRVTADPAAVMKLVERYASDKKSERAEKKLSWQPGREVRVDILAANVADFLAKLNSLGDVAYETRQRKAESQITRNDASVDSAAPADSMMTFVITIAPVRK